jgi:curli biogenesis system outer membrane secretion channel CsgG
MTKFILATLLLFSIFKFSFAQDTLVLKKRLAIINFVDGTEGQTRAASVGTADYNYRTRQTSVATSHYTTQLINMLTTELFRSNAFLLVDRQQIDAVFKEQDLGASGAVTAQSAAKMNQLLGAQLLISGSITEWGNKLENKQHSAGGYWGSSKAKNTARIALDLKITDATTGEIVMAETASGTAEVTSGGTKVMGFGSTGATADNSIMDSALRKAVVNCVALIKSAALKVAWQGSIIKVNPDGSAVVKPGSESGVKPRMIFIVYEKGEELKDPDTGLSLGHQLKKIGSLTITGDFGDGGKAATAKVTSGKGLKAGDVIKPQ